MRKNLFSLVSILIMLSMLLASCATVATEAPPTEKPAVEVPATEAPVVEPTEVPPTEVPPTEAPDDPNALPRNKTLYFNGQQWGSVVCWNPYSSSCNNAMAISQQDSSR
ncbi:MAG: ABC transporter substrate-binding protein, partial [Anaerolineales bacterium]|nr:ABC transporter substrate-binding protein [Anaerolineales bacterium]